VREMSSQDIINEGEQINPMEIDNMAQYLKPTKYITSNSPIIQNVADKFKSIEDQTKRAVAIHDWVRDDIKFGFAPAFWDQTAEQVVKTGFGFCNTKSTLFVAVLRASGIPSRQVFVNILGDILYGINRPYPYVDHSYAEIYLNGKWIKTDSYIVDSVLFMKSRHKLELENRPLGYGIVRSGTMEFDGLKDSFAQFNQDGIVPALSTKYYGVFEDVGDFMEKCKDEVTTGGLFVKVIFRLLSWSFNANIEAIRHDSKL
jgi:hypothetical protein